MFDIVTITTNLGETITFDPDALNEIHRNPQYQVDVEEQLISQNTTKPQRWIGIDLAADFNINTKWIEISVDLQSPIDEKEVRGWYLLPDNLEGFGLYENSENTLTSASDRRREIFESGSKLRLYVNNTFETTFDYSPPVAGEPADAQYGIDHTRRFYTFRLATVTARGTANLKAGVWTEEYVTREENPDSPRYSYNTGDLYFRISLNATDEVTDDFEEEVLFEADSAGPDVATRLVVDSAYANGFRFDSGHIRHLAYVNLLEGDAASHLSFATGDFKGLSVDSIDTHIKLSKEKTIGTDSTKLQGNIIDLDYDSHPDRNNSIAIASVQSIYNFLDRNDNESGNHWALYNNVDPYDPPQGVDSAVFYIDEDGFVKTKGEVEAPSGFKTKNYILDSDGLRWRDSNLPRIFFDSELQGWRIIPDLLGFVTDSELAAAGGEDENSNTLELLPRIKGRLGEFLSYDSPEFYDYALKVGRFIDGVDDFEREKLFVPDTIFSSLSVNRKLIFIDKFDDFSHGSFNNYTIDEVEGTEPGDDNPINEQSLLYPFKDSDIGILSFETDSSRILSSHSASSFAGLLSDKGYENYIVAANISAQDSFSDLAGFIVVAAVRENGREHTLSLFRRPKASIKTYDEYEGDLTNTLSPPGWGLVYNFAQHDVRYLFFDDATQQLAPPPVLPDFEHQSTSSWYDAGISRIYAEKQDNVITAKTSHFGSTVLQDRTIISIDIEELSNQTGYEFLKPFVDKETHFGFGTNGLDIIFSDIVFVGDPKYNNIYDLRRDLVYTYDIETNEYTVLDSSVPVSRDHSTGRLFWNPETKVLYWKDPNNYFNLVDGDLSTTNLIFPDASFEARGGDVVGNPYLYENGEKDYFENNLLEELLKGYVDQTDGIRLTIYQPNGIQVSSQTYDLANGGSTAATALGTALLNVGYKNIGILTSKGSWKTGNNSTLTNAALTLGLMQLYNSPPEKISQDNYVAIFQRAGVSGTPRSYEFMTDDTVDALPAQFSAILSRDTFFVDAPVQPSYLSTWNGFPNTWVTDSNLLHPSEGIRLAGPTSGVNAGGLGPKINGHDGSGKLEISYPSYLTAGNWRDGEGRVLGITTDDIPEGPSGTNNYGDPGVDSPTVVTIISEQNIGILANVATTAAQDGEVLKWNSNNSRWQPAQGGIGTLDLSATNNTTPAGIGSLSYDNAGEFEFTPPDLSGFLSLTNLSATTDTNNASGGGVLTYDNTNGQFTLQPADLSGFLTLTALSVSNLTTGSGVGSIAYNNTTGVFTYTPPDLGNAIGYTDLQVQSVPASGGGTLTYTNSGTQAGTFTFAPADLSNAIGYTDLSVTVSGTASGGGDLSYNNANGTFTFTPAVEGIALVDLSVGTPNNPNSNGAIDYDNTTGEFKYTPPDLSSLSTVQAFLDLSDTPTSFSGDAGKFVAVNTAENSLEFQTLTIPNSIDDLNDVDTSTVTPTVGQVLKWSGSEWAPDNDSQGATLADFSVGTPGSPLGSGSISYDNTTGIFTFIPPVIPGVLSDLGDVSGNTPVGGDVLKWNATASEWQPAADAGAISPAFTDLTDTPANLGTAGQYVVVNSAGTDLEFSTLNLSSYLTSANVISDLSDVSTTAPTTGQVLKWSGSAWEPATDLTSSGSSGIALTDLSASNAANPSGIGSLAYNNTTGVFTFTPPTLSGLGGLPTTSVLSDLTDVNNATPNSNDVLTWDAANSYWKPQAVLASYDLGDLGNVDTTGTSNSSQGLSPTGGTTYHIGHVPIWDGSNYVTRKIDPHEDDIANIKISGTVAANQVLVWADDPVTAIGTFAWRNKGIADVISDATNGISIDDLTDVDISGGVSSGQILSWDGTNFVPATSTSTTFLGMTDTPNSFVAADANRVVRVNSTYNALEFVDNGVTMSEITDLNLVSPVSSFDVVVYASPNFPTSTGGTPEWRSANFTDIVRDQVNLTDLANVQVNNPLNGQVLQYNAAASEWQAAQSTSTSFTGLTDTPSNYLGLAEKFVKVNATATGVEFVDADLALESLTNVSGASPSTGDVLFYAAANYPAAGGQNIWLPTTFTDLAGDTTYGIALSDLNNVNAGSPTNGDTIIYNATTSQWQTTASTTSTFVGLVDTPSTFTSQEHKFVKVDANATGLIFSDIIGDVDDLSDVSLSTKTLGEVLAWDDLGGTASAAWRNKAVTDLIGTIPSVLNDLTDVSTGSPANGAVLAWNSTTSKWEDTTAGSNNFTALNDTPANYTNAAEKFVKVNAAATGLEYSTIAIGDLSNVDMSAGANNGDLLQWSATNGQFELAAPANSSFVNLSDTPSSYGSNAGYLLRVTSNNSGIEFHNLGLQDISDVDAVSASDDGKVLYYDNATTSFKWKVDAGASFALDDITDVSAASPSQNDGIFYTGSGWAAGTPSFNINNNTPSGSGSLSYNAGTFTYVPPDTSGFLSDITSESLTDLSDVDTVSGTDDGKVLYYDNATTSFKWKTEAAGSYTDNDVDTHLNVSGATSGQVLSWTGTDYAWVADQTSTGGIDSAQAIILIEEHSGGIDSAQAIILIQDNSLDSSEVPSIIEDTVDEAYVQERQLLIDSIGGLSNVDISGVQTGKILKWDGNVNKFIIASDQTAGTGSGISLGDLSANTTSSDPNNPGGLLSYDSINGVFTFNRAELKLANMLDLSAITNAADGDMIVFDDFNNDFKYATPFKESDLSVINSPTPDSGGSLYYDPSNATLTYTPPDLSGFVESGGQINLAELGDVDTPVDSNSILYYSSTEGKYKWRFEQGRGGLTDLSDVDAVVSTDSGKVLFYDHFNSKFGFKEIITLQYSDFSAVTSSTPAGGGSLTFSNTGQTAGEFLYTPPLLDSYSKIFNLGELLNVDSATPADDGKVLYYDNATTSFKWKGEAAGDPVYITDIVDSHINLPSATNDYVLSYDGSDYKWRNPLLFLDSLQDVHIYKGGTSLLKDGDVIMWSAANSRFENNGTFLNHYSSIDSLYDVSLTALSTNEVLLWNGTSWTNGVLTPNLSIDSLSNTTIANVTNQQALLYNVTYGDWRNDSLIVGDTVAWANIPDSFVPSSAVIQHESDLSIRMDQIEDLDFPAITGLDSIGDVTISTGTLSSGQVLMYNGTNWENNNTGAELNDLTAAVVWANVPDANITETSVTQHEDALSITASQISDPENVPGWYVDSAVVKILSLDSSEAIPLIKEYSIDSAEAMGVIDSHLNLPLAISDQLLKWNGTDYSWISIDSHLNVGLATPNQLLKWTGTNYIWDSHQDIDSHLNLGFAEPNQILKWTGTAFSWDSDQDTTYDVATTSTDGLMSSTDKSKLDGIDTNANNYSLPIASSSVIGGIKLGYTNSGTTKAVQLNASNLAYVDVGTAVDTNTTYSIKASAVTGGAGLDLDAGGSGSGTDTVNFKGSGATTVTQTDANNITISSTNTTYSTATSSILGLVKIGYTENGKNYPVELSSEQMYVNVPWTDTDTTYTAGNGISLSGGQFAMSGTYTGNFGVTGTITATSDIVAYGTVSDINQKEDISVIQNALEKVKNIRGVTFRYKGETGRMTGVIAQEVAEVLPEVVMKTKKFEDDEETLAVRYGNMVGLLVEAIKELSDKVEVLEEKLKRYE